MSFKIIEIVSFFFRISAFSFLISVFFTSDLISSEKEMPVVKDGRIDISHWDFEKGALLELKGDWKFKWKGLLMPGEILADSAIFNSLVSHQLPGQWGDRENPDKSSGDELLSDIGYATYVLKIEKKGLNFLDDMVLTLGRSFTAHRLYAVYPDSSEVKLLFSNGIVADNSDDHIPQFLRVISPSIEIKDGMYLIFQISNFSSAWGGIFDRIELGKRKDVNDMILFSRTRAAALFGLTFMMGLYHIGLFIQRREDKPSLFFGLLAFDFSIRQLLTTRLVHEFFPELNADLWEWFYRVEFITATLVSYFSMCFIHSIAPRRWYEIYCHITLVLCVLMNLVILAFDNTGYTYYFQLFQLTLIFTMVFTIAHMAKEIARGNKNALAVFIGFVPAGITIVNDILHSRDIISTALIMEYGFGIMIIAQSYILSKMFSEAYRTAEHLSHNLKVEVEKQTVEIRTKSEKMEEQKNVIETQFEKIKNDVLIAADVMAAMLPDNFYENKECELKSFFKPADELAGDLYGMEIKNNRLMFWLCDVTGHGVASSMVAGVVREGMARSRVETIFNPEIPDPASALKLVCDEVERSIKGKFFATMCLAVYDFETNVCHMSSAAHLKPIHLREGQWMKKSFGNMRNGPLIGYPSDSVEYSNFSIKLESGDFLFIYTDGVNEASFDHMSEQFGRRRILRFLKKEHDNPEMLDALFDEVIGFQGKLELDDDITMATLRIK